MKIEAVISVCVFALAAGNTLAQSAGVDHSHGAMKRAQDTSCGRPASSDAHSGCGATKTSASTQEKTYQATGVVKKIDAANNTVTIAHDEIKGLGWPAMTMKFKVKDKALLDQLSTDKRVNFTLVPHGKEYVIAAVK